MKNCKLPSQTAVAVVTDIHDKAAVLQISDQQRQSCAQCHNKGGCQSLSLYQLLFAKRPITIMDKGYRVGQRLRIHFPKNLILHTLVLLLGLPLMGFIVGVLLAGQSHELLGFSLGVGIAWGIMVGGSRMIRRRVYRHVCIDTD